MCLHRNTCIKNRLSINGKKYLRLKVQVATSRVPQMTCIWMSLPGASGLGKLTRFDWPDMVEGGLSRDPGPVLGAGLLFGKTFN